MVNRKSLWCVAGWFMYRLFWSFVGRICFHGGTLILVQVFCSGVSLSRRRWWRVFPSGRGRSALFRWCRPGIWWRSTTMMSNGVLLVLSCHMYLESSVLFWYFWCLNDCLRLLCRSLKGGSVRPFYFMSNLLCTVILGLFHNFVIGGCMDPQITDQSIFRNLLCSTSYIPTYTV